MDQLNLTIAELREYKKYNKEILPDLVKFIDTSKAPSYWKHYDKPVDRQQLKQNKTDMEKFTLTVRGLLNKIFDKNVTIIVNEIKSLEITDKQQLTVLVDLFFKKVITDRNNIKLYANISRELFSISITLDDVVTTFRYLLLTKCQMAFENAMCITIVDEEIDSVYFKFSDEIITFVHFLGELHNQGILKSNVVIGCLDRIFGKFDGVVLPYMLVDIMCAMFNYVSTNLKENHIEKYEEFKNYLGKAKLSKLIKSKEKFMIMDVIDKL